MVNGISIGIKEFQKLPQKEQLTILYENTETLKDMVRGYKFNQKIGFIWLSLLTIITGLGKYLNII